MTATLVSVGTLNDLDCALAATASRASALRSDIEGARDRAQARAQTRARYKKVDRILDLELARELSRDLNLLQEAAGELADDLARDLHERFGRDLVVDGEIPAARDIKRVLMRDLSRVVDSCCKLAGKGLGPSASSHGPVLLASFLVHDFELNRKIEHVLARDHFVKKALDQAVSYAGELVDAIGRVRQRMPLLIVQVGTTRGGLDRVPTPAALATRMICQTVRVIPAADRARYTEEYGAELADMAIAGLSRWAQFIYALRLAMYVCFLRRALSASKIAKNQASQAAEDWAE